MGSQDPRIRYETRRHWYEIVAEVSDFIWWSSIIIMTSFALAQLIDRRAGWLVLLCVYPLGHMFAELVRWNLNWYAIVDMPAGGVIFRQTIRTLTLTGIDERVKEDYIAHMAPTYLSTWFSRQLGFISIKLSSATKAYFDGERVPARLLEEYHRAPRKKKDQPLDNERAMLASNISSWVNDGIVQPEQAAALVMSMIRDNV